MMNGDKTHPPSSDEVAEPEEGGGKGDVHLGGRHRGIKGSRRIDVASAVMRLMCMAASVTAVAVMVTARQTSMASFYGFQLQLHSVWSLSDSFEYLVGVSSAAVAYALLQLLIAGSRLLKNPPVIPSRNQAWIFFATDQIFAYAMMSAASAALGVTNMNRTGIRHTPLPNFCKSVDCFCDHVAVSVVFTLLGFALLAVSSVLDVIQLSKH